MKFRPLHDRIVVRRITADLGEEFELPYTTIAYKTHRL